MKKMVCPLVVIVMLLSACGAGANGSQPLQSTSVPLASSVGEAASEPVPAPETSAPSTSLVPSVGIKTAPQEEYSNVTLDHEVFHGSGFVSDILYDDWSTLNWRYDYACDDGYIAYNNGRQGIDLYNRQTGTAATIADDLQIEWAFFRGGALVGEFSAGDTESIWGSVALDGTGFAELERYTALQRVLVGEWWLNIELGVYPYMLQSNGHVGVKDSCWLVAHNVYTGEIVPFMDRFSEEDFDYYLSVDNEYDPPSRSVRLVSEHSSLSFPIGAGTVYAVSGDGTPGSGLPFDSADREFVNPDPENSSMYLVSGELLYEWTSRETLLDGEGVPQRLGWVGDAVYVHTHTGEGVDRLFRIEGGNTQELTSGSFQAFFTGDTAYLLYPDGSMHQF